MLVFHSPVLSCNKEAAVRGDCRPGGGVGVGVQILTEYVEVRAQTQFLEGFWGDETQAFSSAAERVFVCSALNFEAQSRDFQENHRGQGPETPPPGCALQKVSVYRCVCTLLTAELSPGTLSLYKRLSVQQKPGGSRTLPFQIKETDVCNK